MLKLICNVEMILDRAFAATRDKDHLFNTGLTRLIDRILDERAIDNRQHLFGNGLCRWEETRAQASDRKYSFTNGFMCHVICLTRQNRMSTQTRQAVPQILFSAWPIWAE